MALSRSPA
ncbi:hypothetical protein N7479_006313 [Penicillium vulpinum]|nr:hypothetical protein N7479_006313 [Penicillium vulpinum]